MRVHRQSPSSSLSAWRASWQEGIGTQYKWLVLTVTTVGSLMASLDENVVIVGLPTLLRELNASLVDGVLVVAGYSLTTTILLVAFGRVGDMFGKVKLYNLGFAIFTAASALCGFALSGSQLVTFRLIQGIGGALLLVNSVAIVADTFPVSELGMALGVNFMAWNFGAIAGYTLGGLIVQLIGWRFIFFVNVPVGIFGTAWAYIKLKETKKSLKEKFDYSGIILYSTGLTLLLMALTLEGSTFMELSLLTLGLLIFPVFVFVERRTKHPALDLDLFRMRSFSAGNIASFLNALAYNAVPFIVTFYLQLVRHLDPLSTGLMFIPMEAVVLLVGPLSGRLSDRYGARGLSSLGLLFNASATFWLSTIRQDTSYTAMLLGLACFGVGRGLFASPNVSSIMRMVPAERRGVANGVRLTLIFTAAALSVPLSLSFMSFTMPYDKLSRLTQGSFLPTPNDTATFLSAIRLAVQVSAFLILLAIIPSLFRGGVNKKPDEIAPVKNK